MIRGVISAAGLFAEFAVYQSQGYVAGFLTATAIVAGVVEILSGSCMKELADRMIGNHLPHHRADEALDEATQDAS